jgi:hypothetical protein
MADDLPGGGLYYQLVLQLAVRFEPVCEKL